MHRAFSRLFGGLVACGLLLSGWNAGARAADRIELEIVIDQGAPITAAQEWAKRLGDLNLARVQVRSLNPGDKPEITAQGSPGSRTYRVVGFLTSRNELVVPGQRFAPSDGAAIQAWAKDLIENGPSTGPRVEAPFGLDRKQYMALRKALRQPVIGSTIGLSAIDAAKSVNDQFGGLFPLGSREARKLTQAPAVADEYQGVAAGTAMAAILRSAGLGAVPRRNGASVACAIVNLAPETAVWPVGLSADDRSRELAPELYRFLNAEIDGVSVAETVSSVAPRLKIPVLYDRWALETHGIDPAAVTASMPAKRTSSSLILRKVLFQARLKYELRVDDAGKPFLWITSVKKI